MRQPRYQRRCPPPSASWHPAPAEMIGWGRFMSKLSRPPRRRSRTLILLQIPGGRRAAEVVAIGLLGGELQVHEVSTTVLPVSAAQSANQYVRTEQPDAAAGAVHT